MEKRLNYLDGLRGLAILLVLGYHAYSRWPKIVPYGSEYESFPLFQQGWLGVDLFFIISGFVIFMTLDGTENFRVFIYKRWLRLFPAMLIVSLLVYSTAPIFSERPAGAPNLRDLVPGLLFIEPEWLSKLFGVEFKSLEGAFWSLYLEFKFYIIAGFVYYFLGKRFLVPILLILFIGSVVTEKVQTLKYFGWFCSGALFYLYNQSKKESYYFSGICVALISSVVTGVYINSIIAAVLISCIFALSLRVSLLQRLLTNKAFMLLGLVSYPFYLMHENAMVAMIVKCQNLPFWVGTFFYPATPIAILLLISYVVTKGVEPVAKRFVDMTVKLNLNRALKLYTNLSSR